MYNNMPIIKKMYDGGLDNINMFLGILIFLRKEICFSNCVK